MKVLRTIAFAILLFGVTLVGNGAHAAGFTFAQNLTIGMSGNDVSVLQQFLITDGYLKISTPTNYFGALTRAALGSWQASAGISPAVGYFGPISRGAMNAIFSQALTGTTQTQITADIIPAPVGVTSTAVVVNGDGSPVRLIIPKLNVSAGFQYNGLKSDGTIEVPTNIYDVGWFTGSPRPGEKGVAIITGHVAQIRNSIVTKPGVFSDLGTLRAGDMLSVQNNQGKSITFVVRAIRTYDPAADATDVFVSADGGAHLNLITCEGTWNQSQLSYSQRLVVFTDAVK